MAGTILTSSPHYFSGRLSCLFNEKLAGSGYLVEQTKSPQITLPVWTNKLYTTSLRRKDSMPIDRLVTSMYWVVKWATLIKPKLIRIGPQGVPRGPEWKTQAYMNHQIKSYKWRLGPVKPAFLDGSPQKGQSTTSLPIIKASPSTWKKARWICPNSKPIKGLTWNHAKDPSPSISYMKGSESIQIAQKMTAIKRPKPI